MRIAILFLVLTSLAGCATNMTDWQRQKAHDRMVNQPTQSLYSPFKR